MGRAGRSSTAERSDSRELESRLASGPGRSRQPAQALRPRGRSRTPRGASAAWRNCCPSWTTSSWPSTTPGLTPARFSKASRRSATRPSPCSPGSGSPAIEDSGARSIRPDTRRIGQCRRDARPGTVVAGVRPGYGDGDRQLRPAGGRGREDRELWRRAARDFYDVLGVPATPPPRRSSAPTGSWPGPIIPTSTRTRVPRSASSRSPRPTTCYLIPTSAARYDRFGPDFRQVPEGVDPETWAAGQAGGRPAIRRESAGEEDDGGSRPGFGEDFDFDDLLGGLLGGAPAAGAGPRRRPRGDVELTVEEAFHGGRRRITLPGPDGPRTYEVDHSGRGHRRTAHPVGRPGWPGPGGAPPGDLYLVVQYGAAPHLSVSRAQRHRRSAAHALGGGARRMVAVERRAARPRSGSLPGTSSGKRLRLQGSGMPNRRGGQETCLPRSASWFPHSLTPKSGGSSSSWRHFELRPAANGDDHRPRPPPPARPGSLRRGSRPASGPRPPVW